MSRSIDLDGNTISLSPPSRVSPLRLYQDSLECPGHVLETKALFFISTQKVDLELRSPLRAKVGADQRSLGVLISQVFVEDDCRLVQIPLERLSVGLGFHEVERDRDREWLWSSSRSVITSALLSVVSGPFFLRLQGIFQFE